MTVERRVYQRLHLTRPVDGWFGDFAVRLIDISASGALVEFDDPIPFEARALLRFFWRGEELEILAETARHMRHSAGLHFLDDSPILRQLIAQCATELLAAQEANARGDRTAHALIDETLHAASGGPLASGFVALTLLPDGWRATSSSTADFPEHGFVVRASEPEEQIELLCRSYEGGDAETRRLIRLVAELSIATVRQDS